MLFIPPAVRPSIFLSKGGHGILNVRNDVTVVRGVHAKAREALVSLLRQVLTIRKS